MEGNFPFPSTEVAEGEFVMSSRVESEWKHHPVWTVKWGQKEHPRTETRVSSRLDRGWSRWINVIFYCLSESLESWLRMSSLTVCVCVPVLLYHSTSFSPDVLTSSLLKLSLCLDFRNIKIPGLKLSHACEDIFRGPYAVTYISLCSTHRGINDSLNRCIVCCLFANIFSA